MSKVTSSFLKFSLITFLSKLSGIAKDILLSFVLGVNEFSDAFFIAYKIPSMIKSFIADGTTNSALVPLYTEKIYQGNCKTFLNNAITVLFVISSTLCIAMEILMPVVIFIIAPGLEIGSPSFDMCIDLSRVMLPYVICIALYTTTNIVLQERKAFSFIAFIPMILDIVMIITIIMSGKLLIDGEIEKITHNLSKAIFFAGIIQVILSWSAASLSRQSIITPSKNIKIKDLKELLTRAVPLIGISIITKSGIWIDTLIASTIPGAVSCLYYAERIYCFPRALIGVAMSTVMMSEITKSVIRKNKEHSTRLINRSIEFGLLLCVPASTGIALSASYIIDAMFNHGALDVSELNAISQMLFYFSFSIIPSILSNIMLIMFFANGDIHYPLKASLVTIVVNIISNAIFTNLFGYIGIPISTAISSMVNACMLISTLKKEYNFCPDKNLMNKVSQIFISSATMGICICVADITIKLLPNYLSNKYLAIFIILTTGITSYLVSLTKVFNAYSFIDILSILDCKDKKEVEQTTQR